MSTPIKTAAMRWHRARKALTQAKADLKRYREENGGCECAGAPAQHGPCYQEGQNQDTWCPVCLGSESLFQAKRKAGQEQGAAMRQLMCHCSQEDMQTKAEETQDA